MLKKVAILLLALSTALTFSVSANEMSSDNQEFFSIKAMDVIKVAPRDPYTRCKKLRKGHPNCPDNVLEILINELILEPLKLKCKKAKTCRNEPLDGKVA
jgi:hypothetical protein